MARPKMNEKFAKTETLPAVRVKASLRTAAEKKAALLDMKLTDYIRSLVEKDIKE